MGSEKLIRLAPFLTVNGAIILVLALLRQIDWIINRTLYNYGLVFNNDWYITYSITVRMVLSLLVFALVAVSLLAVFSYRKASLESAGTTFVCKSCGNALSKIRSNFSFSEAPLQFKVLKKCPVCNEGMLDK